MPGLPLKQTDQRKTWRDAKTKYAKVLATKKIMFKANLGPMLDRLAELTVKQSKDSLNQPALANQVHQQANLVKVTALAYKKTLAGLGNPAEKELMAALDRIIKDVKVWEKVVPDNLAPEPSKSPTPPTRPTTPPPPSPRTTTRQTRTSEAQPGSETSEKEEEENAPTPRRTRTGGARTTTTPTPPPTPRPTRTTGSTTPEPPKSPPPPSPRTTTRQTSSAQRGSAPNPLTAPPSPGQTSGGSRGQSSSSTRGEVPEPPTAPPSPETTTSRRR